MAIQALAVQRSLGRRRMHLSLLLHLQLLLRQLGRLQLLHLHVLVLLRLPLLPCVGGVQRFPRP